MLPKNIGGKAYTSSKGNLGLYMALGESLPELPRQRQLLTWREQNLVQAWATGTIWWPLWPSL